MGPVRTQRPHKPKVGHPQHQRQTAGRSAGPQGRWFSEYVIDSFTPGLIWPTLLVKYAIRYAIRWPVRTAHPDRHPEPSR